MKNNLTANMDRHIGLSLLLTLALTFFGCSSDNDDNNNNNPNGDPSSSSVGDGGSSSSVGSGNIESVTIGSQVWMKKNLDVAVAGSKCFGEGGKVIAGYDTGVEQGESWLTTAEIQANCDKYGRLYTWETANAACPNGWHLPDTTEWNVLKHYIENDKGCTSCAGEFLKATSGWKDYYGGNGQDTYGFAALPGGDGYISEFGYYGRAGNQGYWWSASERNSGSAHGISIANDLRIGNYNKMDLFSVRCIKD